MKKGALTAPVVRWTSGRKIGNDAEVIATNPTPSPTMLPANAVTSWSGSVLAKPLANVSETVANRIGGPTNPRK
jgi:hypothetical protein